MNAIVLASSSPRRLELLKSAGIDTIVHPAEINEVILPEETPTELVTRLAKEKALEVAHHYPNRNVLAADTIVYIDNEIIGKPMDRQEARNIIRRLSGRTHCVYTGVCIIRLNDRKDITWFSRTDVSFNPLTENLIEELINNTNPLDKAGGYAIQDHEELLIANYNGLRSNVIGLPIEEVLDKLKLMDITPIPKKG